jgi:hypothetical protein
MSQTRPGSKLVSTNPAYNTMVGVANKVEDQVEDEESSWAMYDVKCSKGGEHDHLCPDGNPFDDDSECGKCYKLVDRGTCHEICGHGAHWEFLCKCGAKVEFDQDGEEHDAYVNEGYDATGSRVVEEEEDEVCNDCAAVLVQHAHKKARH